MYFDNSQISKETPTKTGLLGDKYLAPSLAGTSLKGRDPLSFGNHLIFQKEPSLDEKVNGSRFPPFPPPDDSPRVGVIYLDRLSGNLLRATDKIIADYKKGPEGWSLVLEDDYQRAKRVRDDVLKRRKPNQEDIEWLLGETDKEGRVLGKERPQPQLPEEGRTF